MKARFIACGLGAVLSLLTACETRYAQTAELPRTADARKDAAASPPPRKDAAASPPPVRTCGPTLASRLTLARIDLPDAVRYRRQGYNFIPEDERIAFGIDDGGAPSVGWLDAAGTRVHVTSLDATLARRGADTVIKGIEVGGLAARPDGVAVLVRRDDPGEPLVDPSALTYRIAEAAVLVRIRQGIEQAALPLTGTASVVASTVGAARDCTASTLNGRVEWNGSRFGVYFVVHGCQGDSHARYYGDKLVYLDDAGRALAGGWAWGCSINEGLRLLAGEPGFTPICLSDSLPYQGLNLMIEGKPPVLLGAEESASGYSAGRLGSIVRINDTTAVVGWLSRGVKTNGGRQVAAKPAADIALVKLNGSSSTVGPLTWVTDTSAVAEWGLHLAPYGPGRLLAVWQTFEKLNCNGQTCLGTYTGTHARLMDPDGNFLTPDEIIPATPNDDEDIRVFPNGDLGFAFVDVADRDRTGQLPLSDGGVPDAPPVRTLSVARIAYCD